MFEFHYRSHTLLPSHLSQNKNVIRSDVSEIDTESSCRFQTACYICSRRRQPTHHIAALHLRVRFDASNPTPSNCTDPSINTAAPVHGSRQREHLHCPTSSILRTATVSNSNAYHRLHALADHRVMATCHRHLARPYRFRVLSGPLHVDVALQCDEWAAVVGCGCSVRFGNDSYSLCRIRRCQSG